MFFSHRRLYVIFPAAGSGSRMHSDRNKLLMEVDGVPVIDRTLSAFRRFADGYGIDIYGILVVSPGKTQEWKEYLSGKDYSSVISAVTEGSDTRTKSVSNGVSALAKMISPVPESGDAVFIHDAARCLIDTESLRRCFEAIQEEETFVCVSGVKTKNTIKMVRSKNENPVLVESTPDRDLLYEVQTPQCFKYECLRSCYGKAREEGFEATDDTALAEHFGYDVRIVEGSYSNIKITTPEDIAIAEALLKSFS